MRFAINLHCDERGTELGYRLSKSTFPRKAALFRATLRLRSVGLQISSSSRAIIQPNYM